MNKKTAFFGLFFLATLIYQGCAGTSTKNGASLPALNHSSPHERADSPLSRGALKRDEAALRAKIVEKPVYTLTFSLLPGEGYKATAQVDFIAKKQEQTFLELLDAKILSLKINDKVILAESLPQYYEQTRINLPRADLKAGPNQVIVEFEHAYEATDTGLYRFIDPTDQRHYLYTMLEPHGASRVFPCFDQPDLKAIFKMTVEAPKDWEVIANASPIVSKLPVDKTQPKTSPEPTKLWSFEDTAPISTYLFFLGAGPYQVWRSIASLAHEEDDAEVTSAPSTIPLGLYARKSQAALVDSAAWFKAAKDGLAFFGARFSTPYPFKKLDQIIAPGVSVGGMENVGAIVYSEGYVSKNKPSPNQTRDRINLQLHEIAHQWFGNLVTLRWWNGLWLNESFATWAATWAYEKLYVPANPSLAWTPFLVDDKHGAYDEDSLPTRHPVDVSIADTDAAVSSFDGISYGKGASILKQLIFLIGEDAFQDGLQRYFKKYAFKVATLADFSHMIEEASGWDLKQWQKSWIRTSGVNTVEAQWTCSIDEDSEENEIKTFELKQTADQGLRTHKMRLALYWTQKELVQNNTLRSSLGKVSPAGPGLHVSEPLDVEYGGASTRVENVVGLPCPSMVLLNLDDHDYVRVQLDPKSLATLNDGVFAKIKEPLTRFIIWQSLWDSVVHGQGNAEEFGHFVISQLPIERDPDVLNWLFAVLVEPQTRWLTVARILPEHSKNRAQLLEKLEATSKKGLLAAPPGSELQFKWWRVFQVAVRTPAGQSWLESLYLGKIKINGMPIDGERKSKLLAVLSRLGSEKAKEWREKETEQLATSSPSESQKIWLEYAYMSLPDATSKLNWIERTLKEPLTATRLRSLRGLQLLDQEDFTQTHYQKFNAWMKTMNEQPGLDVSVFESFTSVLYPSACGERRVNIRDAALESLPSPVKIVLLKMSTSDERCIRARSKIALKN